MKCFLHFCLFFITIRHINKGFEMNNILTMIDQLLTAIENSILRLNDLVL